MIESVYSTFGFVGSLVVSLAIFLFFIFWMGGVAGICKDIEKGRAPIFWMALAILVPIYPVGWIIWDMIQQKRELRRL